MRDQLFKKRVAFFGSDFFRVVEALQRESMRQDDRGHGYGTCQWTSSGFINAANDPFLGPACYPREEAGNSDCFNLEIPETGGHVGFPTFGTGGEYWSETRAVGFLEGSLLS